MGAAFLHLIDDTSHLERDGAQIQESIRMHDVYRRAEYGEIVGRMVVAASDLSEGPLPANPRTLLDVEAVVPCIAEVGAVVTSRLYGTRISSLEIGLDSRRPYPRQVREIAQRVRGGDVFIPAPWGHPEWRATLDVAAERRVGVKFRTSGPFRSEALTETQLAQGIRDVVAVGVPFKCSGSQSCAVRRDLEGAGGARHGFLNVMAATLSAMAGERAETVSWWLAVRNGATLANRIRLASEVELARMRRSFVSWGSRSIEDPYRQLVALGLLDDLETW